MSQITNDNRKIILKLMPWHPNMDSKNHLDRLKVHPDVYDYTISQIKIRMKNHLYKENDVIAVKVENSKGSYLNFWTKERFSVNYKFVDGDLIDLALRGNFDVIAHGCNCFNQQKSGIAKWMVEAFRTDTFRKELDGKGDINKLGTIDYEGVTLRAELSPQKSFLYVINAYTQYYYGKNHSDGKQSPIDYEALTLCMRKINAKFPNKHIGLPKIGAGLAGGDWDKILPIIVKELKDMTITFVNYVN